MNKFIVELILQPSNSKYLGRRYISISMSAENEEQAKQFAIESMKSILKDDVDVSTKNLYLQI